MAVNLTINGNTYYYPESGEYDWGTDATDWAQAVTGGMLQKAGGLFTLTADVDFGANYGVKSLYIKSRTTNPATSGQIRLAVSDTISFRNNANTANLALSISGSDELLFNGSTLGNGITALTGDVTAAGTGSVAATIANSAVSLAKMANLAANSIIGNNTGGSATPLALTGTQVTAMLDNMVGDSGSGGTKGLVPAPAAGDAAASKFLSAAGTWVAVAIGSPAWGSITGTLSVQTDLQTALDTKLVKANNLSDLTNTSTARTNLGLGTLATQNGTFSGTSSGTNTGDQTITLTGDVTGSGTGSFATTLASGIDATKIADGSVTSAEFQYINTLSSNAQTQIDGKVTGNIAITGATKTKITYDTKGLVTSGADATTADIADSSNKRYVTDAQLTVIGNTSGTNTGDQTNISGNSGTTNALKSATTDVNVSSATAPTANQVLTATSSTTATWQTPVTGFSDPMTTRGDIIIRNASNVTARLGIGANTYVLTSDGTDISWAASAGGGITALTGDVTASGTGSVAATIAAAAVTLAKMADVATATVFYRKTGGTGSPEVQTLATLKTDLGLSGTNTGDQTITLTGDVTGSGTGSFAATIAAASVSLSKMADLAANSIIGNNTGGAATPLALTGTQVTAMLVDFVGDSGSGGTKGLVKAPSAGDATKFLKGDGTWGTPTGTGDVVGPASSVNNNVVFFDGTTGKLIKDSGLTLSGSNTGDQTITLTGGVTGSGTGSFAATVVTNANLTGVVTSVGNATSIANGAISNAMLANAAVANLSGTNTGDQTSVSGNSGSTDALKSATTTINVSAATAPTSGQVLTATSGTAATWQTPSAGFADPMTTRGDIIIRNASNVTARLGIGANTYVLTSDGTDISWAAAAASGANTALSNLASVLMNDSLYFADGVTGRLETNARTGATASATLNLRSGTTVDGNSGFINLKTGAASGSGVSGDVQIASGNSATGGTGAAGIATGNATTSGNTGDAYLVTGDATSGDSGLILLQTGTATGTRGKIQFVDGSEGTTGHVWTSTDTAGNGHWAAAAGGGDMTLAGVQTVTGAKTFGTIGGAVGKLILAGSTSGSSILDAAAVAGSTTLTLPGTTGTLVGSGDTGTVTSTMLAGSIDATKIADGSVTSTEFQYINTLSSNAQTQIDAKMTNPMTTGGDVIYGGASGTPTRLANGTNGQVLTSSGGTSAPTWTTPGAGSVPIGKIYAIANAFYYP